MKPDPQNHRRRSIRLKGYDYAQPGAYFVTICTQGNVCVLGDIIGEVMHLSQCGQIAHDFWMDIPTHFSNVEVNSWVVMPNHVHAIIVIKEMWDKNTGDMVQGGAARDRKNLRGETQGGETPPLQEIVYPALGQIVAYYKYQTTKRINMIDHHSGATFWQRNYYERIIRNDPEWKKIWQYVQINPTQWLEDQMYPIERVSA
jgi:putative transposase